ncbi:hypothetical protein CEXT_82471 [Caerostris extrusa]|uniref:Uncharacterized protein n=1 Tax=Caerostris extrusa TaxID=172846 RepID=A0AAV4P8V7_CAEEX|nr:hypothetical protein CEXT_82471 [Caerostris extrusa]
MQDVKDFRKGRELDKRVTRKVTYPSCVLKFQFRNRIRFVRALIFKFKDASAEAPCLHAPRLFEVGQQRLSTRHHDPVPVSSFNCSSQISTLNSPRVLS